MIDINNYKKDRTVCKTCYNKNKRKTIITPYPQKKLILLTNNQILKTLKIKRNWKLIMAKTTTMFQHMTVMLMLLLI